MTIYIDSVLPEDEYKRVVQDFKNDRQRYEKSLMPPQAYLDAVDSAFLMTEWGDEDGVLLLKEQAQSIADARSRLHPNAQYWLDQAIAKYGIENVNRHSVFLRAFPNKEARDNANRV